MINAKNNSSYNWKANIFDGICFTYLLIAILILFFRPHESELLKFGRNSIFTLLLFAVSMTASIALQKWGILTLGSAIFSTLQERLKRIPIAWYKTFWGLQLSITFAVTFVTAIITTQFSFYELFDPAGFAGAKRIFWALLTPDWSILPQGLLAITETIFIAFLSTVIAIPVAFLLAFFCAKNIMSKTPTRTAVYFILRTFLNVTRSIEPLIWAIIFSVWVGIGPFAGMLSLMLHSISSLTKQYSEIIEGVSEGPIEAITATGANTFQVVWYGIVPQIVLPYVSFTIYRWDINVRMATVIGLVGGGGIGTMLIQYQGQALWNEVGTLAFLIVVVVWSLDTASAYLREAIK